MGSRKRGREEMEAEEPPKIPSTLDRLRNMWEFACLVQYMFTFGKAVKLEDIDIEVPSLPSTLVPHPFQRPNVLTTLVCRTLRKDVLRPTDRQGSLKLAWPF